MLVSKVLIRLMIPLYGCVLISSFSEINVKLVGRGLYPPIIDKINASNYHFRVFFRSLSSVKLKVLWCFLLSFILEEWEHSMKFIQTEIRLLTWPLMGAGATYPV